jgi:hypothetical protein
MARLESPMWKKLRPCLKALRLDPVRVENPIHPGTPDVNIINAWIELKAIASWPKLPASNVAIRHYTPQQRVWLYRRWRYSAIAAPLTFVGRTYLLLEVVAAHEWLLFDGDVAAELVGRGTQAQYRSGARLVASNPQTIAEFFQPC